MEKYRVSIERCALESAPEEVEEALRRCLDRIGGISAFMSEGDRN